MKKLMKNQRKSTQIIKVGDQLEGGLKVGKKENQLDMHEVRKMLRPIYKGKGSNQMRATLLWFTISIPIPSLYAVNTIITQDSDT